MDEDATTIEEGHETYDPNDLSDLEDGKTRYLIEDGDGEFAIDVPSSWKVTYGKLHGTPGNGYGDKNGNVLRLYETKEKQRAVFLNVKKFRDMSIPLRRKIVRIEENENRVDDGMGRREVRAVNNRQGNWLD